MAKKTEKQSDPSDPTTETKKRLRSLALSRKLLRHAAPATPSVPLAPSSAVVKLDGRDIVKRGQRKSRYLFSFPGLLAPLSAGRVGELADLGTQNPLLYLEFPQGRMKLFGTHVFPKNKYLALQMTKSSKGVEENPEELKLDFPKEFIEQKSADCDFKGGVGGAPEEASGVTKSVKEYIEPPSPDQDDILVESNLTNKQDTQNALEATPVRQSARTAGKTLSYVDPDSGDDPIASDPSDASDPSGASDAEVSEEMDEKVDIRSDNAARRSIFGKSEDSSPATSNLLTSESAVIETGNLTGKVEQGSLSSKKSKANPPGGGILVQATVSSLFEKVAKNTPKRIAKNSPGPKGSAAKRQRLSSKQTNHQVQVKASNKKAATSIKRKSGSGTVSLRKKSKVEDDESEEISSESQDDSDEDWTT